MERQRRTHDSIGDAVLQCGPSHAALEQLHALIACFGRKLVQQKRDSELVQYLDAGHIHPMQLGVTAVEREKVQVIVDSRSDTPSVTGDAACTAA